MTIGFDRDSWDAHWRDADGDEAEGPTTPTPYLVQAAEAGPPGSALDAGCGTGRDAVWLAEHGWHVTGVDIAPTALERAARRAAVAEVTDAVTWVATDLTTWEPERRFDLVTTAYAHATIPQLALYERIGGWVAPGGTLLVVGHRHGSHHRHDAAPPEEATVGAADVAALFDGPAWRVDRAEEPRREIVRRSGPVVLHDVVVRATRLP
ncbi:bifunctional 2-polyprenyl-6-hydroxyphenol methylase/3-demethylubiquinol 3-O-methyltransferase UbiG [Curtobacterium sp. MCBD17_028]|uniref:class I SAM-dependent methyltransferase n=1 Tax=Curtobacterium sp. MCBD17_028 TaxID=2175670 RepID=UPI000DA9556E|nr:class I SAM-dependent methyltransferase [Curtobacterium sp. MCBD17_028]PZE23122.1 SAM-dependent methyltransferase [Curtobacterium sp. MCBD17_028]